MSGRRSAARLRHCRRACGAIRAFAPLARKIDETQPTTGYEDVKRIAHFAAAGRQRRDHSGRLGAVRSEAGASGADLRRRRHRLGVPSTTTSRRDVAVRRSKKSAGAFRPPASSRSNATAASMTMRRLHAHPSRSRQLSQHASAGATGSSAQPRSVSVCGSTCPRNARSCCTPTRSISG